VRGLEGGKGPSGPRGELGDGGGRLIYSIPSFFPIFSTVKDQDSGEEGGKGEGKEGNAFYYLPSLLRNEGARGKGGGRERDSFLSTLSPSTRRLRIGGGGGVVEASSFILLYFGSGRREYEEKKVTSVWRPYLDYTADRRKKERWGGKRKEGSHLVTAVDLGG